MDRSYGKQTTAHKAAISQDKTKRKAITSRRFINGKNQHMGILDLVFAGSAAADDKFNACLPQMGKSTDLPKDDPPDEVLSQPLPEDEPLENLFCQIDYVDADGVLTRRPITMLSLTCRYGEPAIHAFCHLRNALRTFRTDRMVSVTTPDGEVVDAQVFLREVLRLDLTPAKIPTTAEGGQGAHQQTSTPREFRDVIVGPLSVLVSLGLADGHFHREEIDRVMSWAEAEAFHLYKAGVIQRAMTIEEADALGKTIAAMRPHPRSLRRHMLETLTLTPDVLARFRRALQAVIIADNVIDPKELALLEEFDALAAEATRNPKAIIARLDAYAPDPTPFPSPEADLRRAFFVFTGKFVRISRADAMAAVEACNGRVKNHVEFAHQFYPGSCLVVGAGGGAGSKLEKATASGMTVITEDEFLTRLGMA